MHIFQCCLCAGQSTVGVEEGPQILLQKLFPNPTISCIHMQQQQQKALKNTQQTSLFCQELFNRIKALPPKEFVFALGGDHALSIATVLAALTRSSSPLGVLWVDAHADLNTPETSLTGRIHGCPLGLLADLGGCRTGEWAWMQGLPTLKPEQLVYLGLRSVDEAEEDFIRQLGGIRAFRMQDVKERGIEVILDEILQILAGFPRIHLSFDVDAVDPGIISATGTPVPGGLSVKEARAVVRSIAGSGRLGSVDLVEFNPKLGDEERSLDAIKRIIEPLIGELRRE